MSGPEATPAAPYLREAKELVQGGRPKAALDLIWQALACEPLRAETYFLLAVVLEETGGSEPLCRQLMALGLSAALVSEEISDAKMGMLRRAFPEWDARGKGAAAIVEKVRRMEAELALDPATEPEVKPFVLVRNFVAGVRTGLSAEALRPLGEDRATHGRLLLAAAREALRRREEVGDELPALLWATQAVFADATLIPELVQVAAESTRIISIHCLWALQVLVRRSPAEVLQGLRQAGRSASERSVVVDCLVTMPNESGVRAALVELVAEGEAYYDEPDFGYVVALVVRELRVAGLTEEAGRIQREVGARLTEEAEASFAEYLAMPDFYESVVEREQLAMLTIEDVLFDRALCQEDELEGFGEDLDLESLNDLATAMEAPVETFRRETPKLGRNDPCWCGSGKKYKKCHLT